jgi:prepilin-type processing-associated H-X9-DG protein
VIGIIGVLIGLLLPSLRRATEASRSMACKSNLHDLGVHVAIYSTEYKGWIFPVGPPWPNGQPTTLGTNVPPHERWPMLMYKLKGAPLNPLPYDAAAYNRFTYSANDPKVFSAEQFTPKSLRCPSDAEEVAEHHSYVLNQHLADDHIKASSRRFGGLTASDVIVAGEKVTLEPDYHMESGEFDRIAEKFRHGQRLGSNYLHFDGHVDTLLPKAALTGIDPWDLRNPTSQPTNP